MRTYKELNTSTFKTNLPSLTSVPLIPSFSTNYFAFNFLKAFCNFAVVMQSF